MQDTLKTTNNESNIRINHPNRSRLTREHGSGVGRVVALCLLACAVQPLKAVVQNAGRNVGVEQQQRRVHLGGHARRIGRGRTQSKRRVGTLPALERTKARCKQEESKKGGSWAIKCETVLLIKPTLSRKWIARGVTHTTQREKTTYLTKIQN